MKQAIAWILCLLLLVLTVSGCQATDPSGNSSTVSESAPASSQGEESTPESSDETALSSVGRNLPRQKAVPLPRRQRKLPARWCT